MIIHHDFEYKLACDYSFREKIPDPTQLKTLRLFILEKIGLKSKNWLLMYLCSEDLEEKVASPIHFQNGKRYFFNSEVVCLCCT